MRQTTKKDTFANGRQLDPKAEYNSEEGSDYEVIETSQSRMRSATQRKKLGLPKPFFRNELEVGELQTKSKLQ